MPHVKGKMVILFICILSKYLTLLQTFRRLLLNKCQDEFENRSKATEGNITKKWNVIWRLYSSVLISFDKVYDFKKIMWLLP
jgi:hypothetical protein